MNSMVPTISVKPRNLDVLIKIISTFLDDAAQRHRKNNMNNNSNSMIEH